ncbi:MAG: hypothetical protein OXE40_05510 [Gammaproteobacteria bacterium]|nr:hypothetical protein [Gammaproteobacteria bacterium]
MSSEASSRTESLHDELLAVIDELRKVSHLRPPPVVTESAKAQRFVTEALSALQELFTLIGGYLEQTLQPLEPHVSRDAVRAFVLETRRELDELAPRRTADEAYVENLTVTKLRDNWESLAVEVSLDVMESTVSKVARKPRWL